MGLVDCVQGEREQPGNFLRNLRTSSSQVLVNTKSLPATAAKRQPRHHLPNLLTNRFRLQLSRIPLRASAQQAFPRVSQNYKEVLLLYSPLSLLLGESKLLKEGWQGGDLCNDILS